MVTHTHTNIHILIPHMHMPAYSIYCACTTFIHTDVKSVCEWNEMAMVASNPQLLQKYIFTYMAGDPHTHTHALIHIHMHYVPTVRPL